MADESKEELKRRKKEAKAQIKNLKSQQKDNKKEINRIKEENGQRNPSARLTVILVILFLLILLLLIKLDVGGFGTKVLGPIIGDVPYVNKILPASAQQETSGDAVAKAEDNTEEVEATTEAEVTTEAATTEAPKKKNNKKSSNKKNEDISDSGSGGSDGGNGSDNSGGDVSTLNLDPTLKMYVETYTNMEPATAAAILEGMSGDYPLVADILINMDATTRANILAAMNPNNATKISKIMEGR